MKQLLFFLPFLLLSCDEMYDEEFEEFEASRNETTTANEYTAELETTDDSIPDLNGSVDISIRNDTVNVNLRVDGIPQNFTQIHYGYINTSCLGIEREFSADLSSTRSFNITEDTSLDALRGDLSTSGADENLQGKSFIVKAFPLLPGIPNPEGTAALTIACGVLEVTDDGTVSNDDIFDPDRTTDPADTGTGIPDDTGDVGTDETGTSFPETGTGIPGF